MIDMIFFSVRVGMNMPTMANESHTPVLHKPRLKKIPTFMLFFQKSLGKLPKMFPPYLLIICMCICNGSIIYLLYRSNCFTTP